MRIWSSAKDPVTTVMLSHHQKYVSESEKWHQKLGHTSLKHEEADSMWSYSRNSKAQHQHYRSLWTISDWKADPCWTQEGPKHIHEESSWTSPHGPDGTHADKKHWKEEVRPSVRRWLLKIYLVEFLWEKSEAFEKFRKLCLNLEFEKELRVKRVRNGHEFENEGFDVFCSEKGIQHEFSAPKTPQQNGVVERNNITL